MNIDEKAKSENRKEEEEEVFFFIFLKAHRHFPSCHPHPDKWTDSLTN